MLRNQLRLKLSLYLMITLLPVVVLLPYFVVRNQQEDMQQEVSRHVTQIGALIVRSTRYAMLVNRREIVGNIIEDVGRQAGIERVRVLTKDGVIIHSKGAAEVGRTVDRRDEPCIGCHRTSKPLQRVPDDQRWRVYQDAGGRRLLSAMEPIRNEPSCSNASCHEHPASQSVLGVVDIAYSLDEIDGRLQRDSRIVAATAAVTALAVAALLAYLLQRLIYLPLSDLNAGAKRISDGDMDCPIPIRSDDEFGQVARSFNRMSQALQRSMGQLQDLVQTLEKKVAERTGALRAAQAEVVQSEKLASIGVLASGIAHEMNNPLTGVLTFASLLRKKLPDGSPEAGDMDLVIRETRRCASIIRRLLDFAREKVPAKGFFSLNALIEDVVRFVDRPATLQNIAIRTEIDPGLPQVWGDAELIRQVVLNIVVNATQAITGDGRIVVATRRLEAAAGQPDAVPMVEVSISDNGCGIPEENLQRIFDPFFTTKEVGGGTGLGLSVSYGIIRAHGGAIKVESVVGEGSTFRIHLPTAGQPTTTERPAGEVTP